MEAPKVSAEISKEKMGQPGIHQVLVVLGFNKESEKNPEEKLHDKTSRAFNCTASFSKNQVWSTGIDGRIDKEASGSFIVMENNVVQINIYSPSGLIVGEKNSKGELCLLKQSVEATSVHDARDKFFNNITPYVDYLSFKANIPILVEKFLIMDTLHPIQAFDNISPYFPIGLNPHIADLNPEMFPIMALYRESKINPSPFYRLLCHFKILEGIYKKLRPELFAKAKKAKIELSRPKEVVPEHPELKIWEPDYIGKSIPVLYQGVLTKDYRNEVAHFLLENGSFLNVSDNSKRAKYDRIVLLTEICVHIVMENQDKMFTEFRKFTGKHSCDFK